MCERKFCKNQSKKGNKIKLKKRLLLAVLGVLLLLICFTIFGIIDIKRFQDGKEPVFIVEKIIEKDGGTTLYYGIGYQLISWNRLDEKGHFVGKEYHILRYCDFLDGPSVPLAFEPDSREEENYALLQYVYVAETPEVDISICVGAVVEEGQRYSSGEPYKKKILIYETTADITHDGIDDLIQVFGYNENEERDILDQNSGSKYDVRVYRGLQDGTFGMQPRFISDMIYTFHSGNGTICLCHKEGQDYLLIGHIYEMQGTADYSFAAFYVDDEEGVVADNQYYVNFACDKEMTGVWNSYPHRDDVLPEFKERISPYIEDAVMLISTDKVFEIFYSTSEQECEATEFFNQIWERDY